MGAGCCSHRQRRSEQPWERLRGEAATTRRAHILDLMATNVIARSSSTGAILLSWDPVCSVQPSGYRILIQADGAGPYRERPEDREARGSDTLSRVVPGLSVGSSYKFKVAAQYPDQQALTSAASNAVTPCMYSPSKEQREARLSLEDTPLKGVSTPAASAESE